MAAARYIGSKNANGVLHTIINNIPFHKRYFELFAGSAAVYRAKLQASYNYLCDISPDQVSWLNSAIVPGKNLVIKRASALAVIDTHSFTSEDFIYLDPPYPFSSRRSGNKYYKFEMQDNDHIDLLKSISTITAAVMISTRANQLYESHLATWRKVTIPTADRAGACEEIIYMNYDFPEILHQYDYVGQNFGDRQRINRKIARFQSKLSMLPAWEKHLFIQELIRNDYAGVKHFLTMMDHNRPPATNEQ